MGVRVRWRALSVALVLVAATAGLGAPAGGLGTTSAVSTWQTKILPFPANDVVYDVGRDVVLASVPASEASIGNQLVELDPETGALGRRVTVGPEPGVIALTDDGSAAYVALTAVPRIVKVDLASFTVASSFAVPKDSYSYPLATDLEVMPGRNDVVAAAVGVPDSYGRIQHSGVWIFDDGVALVDHTPAYVGAAHIEFGDATTLYGFGTGTDGNTIRRMTVSTTGVTVTASGTSALDQGAPVADDIEYVAGQIYGTNGVVIDPETFETVGTFPAGKGPLAVTLDNGRATFVWGSADVRVFDTSTYALVEYRQVSDLMNYVPAPAALVATGTGFVMAGAGGVVLLGPSVGGPAVVLPMHPTPTMLAWGVVQVDIEPADVVYDARRKLLYVSVTGDSPSYANQVVKVNSETGAIAGGVYVGTQLGSLALTDDGSVLYVSVRGAAEIRSIDPVTFTVTGGFGLGSSDYYGPLVAGAIAVQPGTTDVLAVEAQKQMISPPHDGIRIYDGGVQRTNHTRTHTGPDHIAFGADPSVLYGTGPSFGDGGFYRMTVDDNGVAYAAEASLPGGYQFDLADERLYTQWGYVVDGPTGEMVGRFGPISGVVHADLDANRAFYATSSNTLVEYVADRFTKVAERPVDFGSSATKIVGTSTGVAVATWKRVVLLTSATGAIAPPSISAISPSTSYPMSQAYVTINGSGLLNTTAVRFGSTAATQVQVVSDSRLSVLAPALPAGVVDVTVETIAGSATLAGGFRYEVPPPPPPPTGTLRVSRFNIDFGNQRVHTYDPGGELFEIYNIGPGPVTVTAFAFSGDAAWAGVTDCRPDVPLASGARCNAGLVFLPDRMGGHRGELRVFGSSGPSTAVTLTGNGAAGYFTATDAATLLGFGDAWPAEDWVDGPLRLPVVGMATTPNGAGQWLVASDGGIFSFGDAAFYGSTGALRLNQPIVGMASTPTGEGYWLVASDGGIFTFGDARFFGSTGAMRLNQPIVGMASTPTGEGYWLVASDGGIFSFGDARFFGSTGAMRLNQPIVGMASTGSGNGYWFVASDGGIFSFGDAAFYGSTGAMKLNQPIVGMAASPTARGYWFTARDGGIFSFGDAPFFGSAAPSPEPVVAMAGTAPVFPSGGAGVAASSAGGAFAGGGGGGGGRIVVVDDVVRGLSESRTSRIWMTAPSLYDGRVIQNRAGAVGARG